LEATRPLILLTRNSAVTPTRTVSMIMTICGELRWGEVGTYHCDPHIHLWLLLVVFVP
jgi:hypothetical protein